MRIAVLGGGNGSFAAAGDFALQGHDVRLWRRDARSVMEHRATGSGITVKDAKGRHEVQLALVTTDIAEVTRDSELIICPAPAFAQHDIASLLSPHLVDGQVVFLPPATFGSMIFAMAARNAGNRAKVSFAETGTLPWLTLARNRTAVRGHDLPDNCQPEPRTGPLVLTGHPEEPPDLLHDECAESQPALVAGR